MKKALILGANGYIGAKLSTYLSDHNYLIDGVCYPQIPVDKNWQNKFNKLYNLDLKVSENIDIITNSFYETVINLVSLDHNESNGEPNYVNSVNVMPTINLLKYFSEKENLNRFIYFSTIHVYGQIPPCIITEEQEPNPKNIYGLTHLLAEQVCNYYNNNSGINCIVVRLSNSYGSPIFKDNNCWCLAVNEMCKSAFYKEGIYLKSNGYAQRDFIHSLDVCRALEILTNDTNKTLINNIYHVSSGRTYTILELSHIVKKVFNERYNKKIDVFLPDSSISEDFAFLKRNKYYTISNEKIKQLGFIPETELEQGMLELFYYFEHNHG